MSAWKKIGPYAGGYVLGLLVLLMELLRLRAHYAAGAMTWAALAGLGVFATAFALELLCSSRGRFPWALYFALQLACILFLAALPPFLDVLNSLFLPLYIQAYYRLPRPQAARWALLFSLVLLAMMVTGLGLLEGVALGLQTVAEALILTTLAVLVVQSHADREQSQALVAGLQEAQSKLQEYTRQAAQLVEERERNHLRRELHDSVGQTVFSLQLTCAAARLLLERDPARAAELLERMQGMSSAALSRLRSIITELHPGS